MLKYALKRVLQFLPTLALTTFVVFFAMTKAQGNPAYAILGENADLEQVRELEHRMGLDKGIFERYADYMAGVFKGDMGISYVTGKEIFPEFCRHFHHTLRLSLLSLAISSLIAVPLGVLAAAKRGGFRDALCSAVSLFGMSMPSFWLSILLILAFSYLIPIFPSAGTQSFKHYILPSLSVSFSLVGLVARVTRNSMVEEMAKEYVTFARSKGVSEARIIWKHCLKNSTAAITTAIGQQASFVLTGSTIAETVFSIPGAGRLILNSISTRDMPMVTGAIMLCCIIMSSVSLLSDMFCALADPRIRDQMI